MRNPRFPSALVLLLSAGLIGCRGGDRPRTEKLTPTASPPATPAPIVEAPRPDAGPLAASTGGDAGVAAVEEPAQIETPADDETPLPATFDERLRLGKKLARSGDVDGALAALAGAAALEPANARPRIEMARVLIAENDLRSAAEQAQLAVELAPGSSAAWNTKGRVLFLSRDTVGAIDAFGRAASLDAENAYAWNNLGLALLAAGRTDEAAAALENATGLPRAEAYMWNNLGAAYEKQRRMVEAKDAYKEGGARGSSLARQSFLRLEEQTAMAPDGTDGGSTE